MIWNVILPSTFSLSENSIYGPESSGKAEANIWKETSLYCSISTPLKQKQPLSGLQSFILILDNEEGLNDEIKLTINYLHVEILYAQVYYSKLILMSYLRMELLVSLMLTSPSLSFQRAAERCMDSRADKASFKLI